MGHAARKKPKWTNERLCDSAVRSALHLNPRCSGDRAGSSQVTARESRRYGAPAPPVGLPPLEDEPPEDEPPADEPPLLLAPEPPVAPALLGVELAASPELPAPDEVPPAELLALSSLAPADCSPELALSSLEPPEPVVEPEPVVDVDVDVEVVAVELVRVASFSAEVLLGGVISGVLRGVASDTLPPPPHAPRATPQASTSTVAPAAMRGARAALGPLWIPLTRPAGPSGAHRWDSR
jgi:hypothetical protein